MRLPFGCQAGERSSKPPLDTLRWSVPSAFITKISRWYEGAATRSLSNAIRVPSGDQAGRESAAASLVSRCWPEPSAFMT